MHQRYHFAGPKTRRRRCGRLPYGVAQMAVTAGFLVWQVDLGVCRWYQRWLNQQGDFETP